MLHGHVRCVDQWLSAVPCQAEGQSGANRQQAACDAQQRATCRLYRAGVLQRLTARLAELNKSVFLPDRGNMSMAACTVGVTEYGGFYGPFA